MHNFAIEIHLIINFFVFSRTIALHRHLVIDALTDEDIEAIFLSEEIDCLDESLNYNLHD